MPPSLSPPSERAQFAEGMRLHNEGEYYEAHEAWEDLWRDELNDEWRLFLQGLIQVTSAFHKLFVQRQPSGALRLLQRGLGKLKNYCTDYWGLALGSFVESAHAWETIMSEATSSEGASARFYAREVDRARVPRLCWLADVNPGDGT